MFSFKTLAVYAAVAFTAVSAIPLSTPVGDLPLPDLPAVPIGSLPKLPVRALPNLPAVPAVPAVPGVPSLPNVPGVPSVPSVPSVPRQLPDISAVTGVVDSLPVGGLLPRDAPQSIAVVLTAVHEKLIPVTDQLKFITAANATLDHVAGPIGEIKDILTGAVVSLHALIGQPAEIILASVGSTAKITVEELAKIVAGVVCVVFTALGAVVTVAGGAIDKAVFDLLVVVGGLVGTILALVFALVGTILADLLVVLVPLVKTVVPFILHLNIATVISILHL